MTGIFRHIWMMWKSGGHGFAKLGDEYADLLNFVSTIPDSEKKIISRRHNIGWYANVDITEDPAAVRWCCVLSLRRHGTRKQFFMSLRSRIVQQNARNCRRRYKKQTFCVQTLINAAPPLSSSCLRPLIPSRLAVSRRLLVASSRRR